MLFLSQLIEIMGAVSECTEQTISVNSGQVLMEGGGGEELGGKYVHRLVRVRNMPLFWSS